MLRLGTPLIAAFMPLVPDASSGGCGVLSQTSTQKAAWTFDDFLRSLELNVRNLVEQETKAHADRA